MRMRKFFLAVMIICLPALVESGTWIISAGLNIEAPSKTGITAKIGE